MNTFSRAPWRGRARRAPPCCGRGRAPTRGGAARAGPARARPRSAVVLRCARVLTRRARRAVCLRFSITDIFLLNVVLFLSSCDHSKLDQGSYRLTVLRNSHYVTVKHTENFRFRTHSPDSIVQADYDYNTI